MFLAVVLASFLAMQADLLDRGRAALESGDFVKAEQLFREYIKQDPKSAEAYSNLATVYSRRGELQQAVELYEKALKANPALAPVHFNIAVQLGKLRRFDDAAGHLREFLKSYPNEPRAHQLLGLCLVETGEVRAALSELEASYKANPNDGSIRYALAYANARAGDVDRAAELFRDADSNQAQSKFIQGLIEYRQQNFDKAKVLLQDVVREMPDAHQALAALGRIELNARNDQAAIELLERAVKLNPSDAESTYQLGVLYDRVGRTADGIAALRRALTLRANYPDPHYQLGRIAFNKKDYKTAVTELEEARRLLPGQEAIRLLLGRVYQAVGRANEAKVEFAEVRKLKSLETERATERVLTTDEWIKP